MVKVAWTLAAVSAPCAGLKSTSSICETLHFKGARHGEMHGLPLWGTAERRRCGGISAWTGQGAGVSLKLIRVLLSRKAKTAMEARFGSVWESVRVFQTPTLASKVPELFSLASSRRGGLAGVVSSSTHPRTLQKTLRREQEVEERVEHSAEEEEASDDDVGPLLGQVLGME